MKARSKKLNLTIVAAVLAIFIAGTAAAAHFMPEIKSFVAAMAGTADKKPQLTAIRQR